MTLTKKMAKNDVSKAPIWNIEMNFHEIFHPDIRITSEEACEVLNVARQQEAKLYRCRDYIGRLRRLQVSKYPVQAPDAACRRTMCEWAYRICDCGQISCERELVAVAFSYLDRFLDRCTCDRSSFKLAAVTAFWMATKIFGPTQISPRSLADLSRGEFELQQILDMEKIMLRELEWHVNPPVAQSFIRHLLQLFGIDKESCNEIYRRAIFFAELSVYEYMFVSNDHYMIAVACLLNSMEFLEDDPDTHIEDFASLKSSMVIDLDSQALEKARARLWYLYSSSAESLPTPYACAQMQTEVAYSCKIGIQKLQSPHRISFESDLTV